MNKYWYIYTMEYYSAVKRNEVVIPAITYCREGDILYDSIYMKYSEQANPQRQKVDQWVPGSGGRELRTDCLMVKGFLHGDKHFLELDNGDGCTTY